MPHIAAIQRIVIGHVDLDQPAKLFAAQHAIPSRDERFFRQEVRRPHACSFPRRRARARGDRREPPTRRPSALPHPQHYTMKTMPEFSRYKAETTEQIRVESIRAVEMGAA